MRIHKDVIQKIIEHDGAYLIANRYCEGMGASRGKDEWYAMFISIPVPMEMYDKRVDDLSFGMVEKFVETEITTCLHLGKSYPPFQYGIRPKDIIAVEKVTCDSNELIARCYQENIKDYYKVIEIMKEMTPKQES